MACRWVKLRRCRLGASDIGYLGHVLVSMYPRANACRDPSSAIAYASHSMNRWVHVSPWIVPSKLPIAHSIRISFPRNVYFARLIWIYNLTSNIGRRLETAHATSRTASHSGPSNHQL